MTPIFPSRNELAQRALIFQTEARHWAQVAFATQSLRWPNPAGVIEAQDFAAHYSKLAMQALCLLIQGGEK